MLKRFSSENGIQFTCIPADKFNRCRMSIFFMFPAERETATAHALLPLVMERGCASCPDMTQMSKRLASLYGAELSVDGRAQGANHVMSFSVTGIKNKFALEGENLAAEYLRLLTDAAFYPYLVNGAFDAGEVEIEKAMLKRNLEDEINDKRIYCQKSAVREFYGDTAAGIRQDGYLEEVDGITPQQLYDAYRDMLCKAQVEVVFVGLEDAQQQEACAAITKEFSTIRRSPVPVLPFQYMPKSETRRFSETYDMVQAKLCLLFTLNETSDLSKLQAYRLAMSLFGGSVTSRLFLNVREKMNLCYYCSSSFQTLTACMAVNSGIEPANAAVAEKAILNELEMLCSGPITDEELEDCRRGMLSDYDSITDSVGGTEAWYVAEILRGGAVHTPEEAKAELRKVTKEEVRSILKQFSLSVSYLLTPEKNEVSE